MPFHPTQKLLNRPLVLSPGATDKVQESPCQLWRQPRWRKWCSVSLGNLFPASQKFIERNFASAIALERRQRRLHDRRTVQHVLPVRPGVLHALLKNLASLLDRLREAGIWSSGFRRAMSTTAGFRWRFFALRHVTPREFSFLCERNRQEGMRPPFWSDPGRALNCSPLDCLLQPLRVNALQCISARPN